MGLLDKLNERKRQNTQTAWNLYRAILQRADSPRAKDAENLEALFPELGVSTADVAADLQALSRVAELIDLTGGLADAVAEAQTAGSAYTQKLAEVKAEKFRIDRELKTLNEKRIGSQSRRNRAQKAKLELDALMTNNPRIFSTEECTQCRTITRFSETERPNLSPKS